MINIKLGEYQIIQKVFRILYRLVNDRIGSILLKNSVFKRSYRTEKVVLLVLFCIYRRWLINTGWVV